MSCENSVRHFVAIQTYGWVNNNLNDDGSNGTKNRIIYADTVIKNGVIPINKLVVVFPQGFSKRNPTEPSYDGQVSLGKNAGDYFKSLPGNRDVWVIDEARSWGTEGDVEAIFDIASTTVGDCKGHIHFFSDPCHIRRVMIIGNAYVSARITASYHPVMFHRLPRFQRFFREPIARAVMHFTLRGFEKYGNWNND